MQRATYIPFRPWTIQVLTFTNGAVLLAGLMLLSRGRLWELPVALVGLWTTYSLWMGKRWAFSLTFMLASLALGALAVLIAIDTLLLQQRVSDPVILATAAALSVLTLLSLPMTKRYAGLDVWSESS